MKANNESRDFKGVWIPREIWLDEGLSMTEKCLLTEIHSLDNENGCFASIEYFASFLCVSKVTISRAISKLEISGYITREIDGGRRQILHSKMTCLPCQNDMTPMSKRHDTHVNLSLPSNYINNTLNNTLNKRADALDLPDNLKNDAFLNAWKDWLAYRRERRLSTKPMTLRRQAEMLSRHTVADACAIIEQSITQGWQGLFELKGQAQKTASIPPPEHDHEADVEKWWNKK